MTARINFNSVAAVLFIAFAVILFLIIPHQIDKPMIVLSQDENNLKASLFPQLVAGCLLVLGIWFLFKSPTLREENQFRKLDRSALINVLVTLVAMLIYGPAMMELGFVVSSAIMIAFLSTFYGNRNHALTAVVSVCVPIAMYFCFSKLLSTSLPPFPIDTILTNYSIL